MSIFETLVVWITDLIDLMGYQGIFILMMLESAGIPIPSEAVVTFSGFLAVKGRFDFWLVVFYSTISNLVGSLILYFIALFFGRGFIDRYGKYFLLEHRHIEIAENWFNKYGSIAVFMGRITPAIRTYISFPAGIGRMSLYTFVLYTLVGSFIWNYILAYFGTILGENWHIITNYLDILGVVAIVILVTGLFLYYRKIRKTSFYRWSPISLMDIGSPTSLDAPR